MRPALDIQDNPVKPFGMVRVISLVVAGLILLSMAGVMFIKHQIYRTAFPDSNPRQYIIDRPDLPVPILVLPESFGERVLTTIEEFNGHFPTPLLRLAASREEAEIILIVTNSSAYEDKSLNQIVLDEYRRIYGDMKTAVVEALMRDGNRQYRRREMFPCSVSTFRDVDLLGDPRLMTGELEPDMLLIEAGTKKSLLAHSDFDSCIREEIAHAFFYGGLPDRALRPYERSIFNSGGGYQSFIENYTWSDLLTMRVLLYAMQTDRWSKEEFNEVIRDYFLSRLFE